MELLRIEFPSYDCGTEGKANKSVLGNYTREVIVRENEFIQVYLEKRSKYTRKSVNKRTLVMNAKKKERESRRRTEVKE